jgi:NAD(P)-dependent dehydrogenase (short-subunit alcohol dehydrogenase family)
MSSPLKTGLTESDVPDQSGKFFIVTGANTGIGFEASRVLAAREPAYCLLAGQGQGGIGHGED